MNICNDLLTLETFQATASDQAGKFTKILLAGATTGASSLVSGGALSELVATPATNIPLHHLDISSLAATGATNRGRWKQLLLAETTGFPNTNIQLRDISSTAFLHTSTDGHWKNISLGTERVGTTSALGLPNTNIGILNLKGAVFLLTSNSFQPIIDGVAANSSPQVVVLANITAPTSNGTFKYHLMSLFLRGVAGTVGVSTFYMYGMGGFSTSSTAATNYSPMLVIKTSGADGATQWEFQCRVIEIAEV